MTKTATQKTLNSLLAGRSSRYKKYAGKHVLIIGNTVVPAKKGEAFWKDFRRLQKKHGERPVVAFVPSPDTSYILEVW